MTPVEVIASVGTDQIAAASGRESVSTPPPTNASAADFSKLLGEGLAHVEQRIAYADETVRAFALDDTLPVHQVTIALEEARIAMELAMQVRTRLVEAYREIMNTQL